MNHRTLDTVLALSIFAVGMVGAWLAGLYTGWNPLHFLLALVGMIHEACVFAGVC